MTVSSSDVLARARPPALPLIAASAAMTGLAGMAWWWTIGESRSMSSMAMGLAQVDRAMTFDMPPAAFMGMWAAMMVAMMLPSIAPRALAYAHGRMPLATTGSFVAFLAVYFVAWTVTGVPALVGVTALSHVGHTGPWLERTGAAMLVFAGAYQFTRAKNVSLRSFRTPVDPSSAATRGGAVAASRSGLRHALACVCCCWALIAVLFVVGVMNLAWIAALTVVCLAERSRRYGGVVTKTVGVALIGVGLAVLVHPAFLIALA